MLKLLIIFSSFIIFICISSVRSDYYTSVIGLEKLIGLESMWVENFEKYVKGLEESSKLIKKYLDTLEKEFNEETKPFFEDPLSSFQTIKRVISDWKQLEDIALNTNKSDEYTEKILQTQTELGIKQPTTEDLRGAAKSLARLQRTYNLETEGLANGKFLATESSAKMNASDCFWLGRSMYENQNYQHAIEWLIEARALIQKSKNLTDFQSSLEIADENILELLGPAFFDIGNFKMAVKYNKELLFVNPNNEYGLRNMPLFEEKLIEIHAILLPSNVSFTLTENQTEVERRFEAVCRGDLSRKLSETRNLRCRYVSNNIPFCILAPFKMEELSLDPVVVYYHESIYESEISQIEISVMDLERLKIESYGMNQTSEALRNKVTGLLYENHGFLNALAQRLTDMTGLSLKRAEALQVANYGIGGHFEPHYHHDDFSNGIGNRMATASVFLNNVELGGAMAFPILRLVVPSVWRSLVLWYNMHESSEFDYRTIHAGCPVLKGSKWIFNEWFHAEEQEFRRPCSLQQQGYKSIEYKHFSDLYNKLLSETKTNS